MALSTLGLGTYLGPPTEEADARYVEAARAFSLGGGTVFDTAANYRRGRSEWALGHLLPGLHPETRFISTKAGYLPMGDGVTEESPRAWFQRVLAGPGVLNPGDLVDDCHALTPRYLRHQLVHSCRALGLPKVDLFHLHNPEQQRAPLGPERFREVMLRAFEACEALVQEGLADAFGCATWNGFRVPPETPEHLCLDELVELARDVAGPGHHFHWIQLPLNLAMPEAWLAPTQPVGGATVPALEAARLLGLRVQASASLMQARILPQLPADLPEALGVKTPAQAALQFTRSCPGVDVALCGMGQAAHVAENLGVLGMPKADPAVLRSLLG